MENSFRPGQDSNFGNFNTSQPDFGGRGMQRDQGYSSSMANLPPMGDHPGFTGMPNMNKTSFKRPGSPGMKKKKKKRVNFDLPDGMPVPTRDPDASFSAESEDFNERDFHH